jgi:hypothetical protein
VLLEELVEMLSSVSVCDDVIVVIEAVSDVEVI